MSRPSILERLFGQRQPVAGQHAHRRRIFFEPLEERRVLAASPICDCGGGGGGGGGWALDAEFGTGGLTNTDQGAHERIFDIAAKLGIELARLGDERRDL